MVSVIVVVGALTGHLPACALYSAPQTDRSRDADSALVSKASGHATPPTHIEGVQQAAGWRLIWARPNDSEPGVFFFRKEGSRYVRADTWGGVAQEVDRPKVIQWATRLKLPAALAQCFASKLIDEGP